METPIRRPPGPVVAVDNRLRVGTLITMLLAVQAALFSAWCCSTSTSDNKMYLSFFTAENSNVPIFSHSASVRSNYLVSITVLNFVIAILFLSAQQRTIFTRPLDNTSIADLDSSYTQLANEAEYADDSESTPLGHSNEKRTADLVDSPEFNSSWFNRITFSWINDLLHMGAARKLGYSDLYNLSMVDMPVPNWKRHLNYRKPGRSLFITISLAFAPELLLQAALFIVICILEFTGPFFLQRIIRSIELSSKSSVEISIRHLYLDAFGLLFFTLFASLTIAQDFWLDRQIAVRLKGILVAELTSKTLHRQRKGSLEKKKNTSKTADNEEVTPKASSAAADGKIMNLLTADFHRVLAFPSYLHGICFMPLSLGIGIWYMYQMLGVSALIGLSLACIYALLTKMLFTRLAALQKKLNVVGDRCVSMIIELLQGIVSSLGPMLILIVIFATHVVVFGNNLTAEVAFTSISVFQIVCLAMQKARSHINSAIGGYVSLDRIHLYLDQPQIQDLEKRVALEFSKALGFECADLEWESPEAARKDYSKTSAQDSVVASKVTIKDGIPDGEFSNHVNRPTEETPLLAGSSHMHVMLSTNASTTSLSHQGDLAAFSLKSIDIQFPIGGLSIVAGPTGSGKSSLLSALAGDMTLTRGRILLPTVDARVVAASDSKYKEIVELSNEGLAISDIAYVAQEAWLRNATIRENILFGEPYNKDRYEVLRACALKPDLRILSAGDMTGIGERGVTFSGGQKQRLSLARAVYSSRRILLIDDYLSAVDAHTGKHILMECLLNKSNLMQGRTRVLVTHHVSMCLPFAQFLVVMHESQISLKSTPVELQLQCALIKTLAEVESNKCKDTTSEKLPKVEAAKEDCKGKSIENMLDNSSEGVSKGTLVEDEKREGFVKLEVWKTYLSACGNKKFWALLVLMLTLWQAVLIAQNYWIRIWVTSNSRNTNTSTAGSTSVSTLSLPVSFYPTGSIHGLVLYLHPVPGPYVNDPVATTAASVQNKGLYIMLDPADKQQNSNIYWLGIYVLIGFVNIFGRAIQNMFIFQAAINASRTLHARLMQAIVCAAPRFFDSTPVGRIISRFSRDMHTIDKVNMDQLVSWISDIIAVLGVYAIVSSIAPVLILITIAITALYAGIAYYYLNTSRELKRLESNSMSPLLSLFSELILGVSTIRAFGIKHYYIKEALNRISAQNRSYFLIASSNRWFEVRIDLSGAVVSFCCAMFVIMNHDWIDAGLAGFTLSYALTFSKRMHWVIRNYNTNEFNMNAVERVKQYFSIEQEAALESKPEHKPPKLWPTKGDVQIDNLAAEYMPGVLVLHGISLSVKHGEKVGVVGRTGAGKSTPALALLRFVEASRGRIVLGGVDISKIGLDELRHKIVWDALRRTHLVRENSSQNQNLASINDGRHSDRGAGALAFEHMSRIFSSLDAGIKENGQNLSLEQQQLVTLARALVRRSRLIIMDEATASVDFDIDDRIQRTIRGYEFVDSTLFCIVHRLRTIIDYDRVLVLDKGKAAEFAMPYNLLQNKDGIFRSMCEKSGEYEYLVATATSWKSSSPS
ncbi:hypothetical protein GGI26_005394 [Coemansia sp. RSA 1358]|nr:hypothetical protein GGI26_005394 [Coemansia sp. RSA 1358]